MNPENMVSVEEYECLKCSNPNTKISHYSFEALYYAHFKEYSKWILHTKRVYAFNARIEEAKQIAINWDIEEDVEFKEAISKGQNMEHHG
jgi:hypothetical protein